MPRVFKPTSVDAGVVARAAHAAITPRAPAPSANRPHPPPLEDARMPSSPDASSGALSARLVAESVMMRGRPRASRARVCETDARPCARGNASFGRENDEGVERFPVVLQCKS